MLPNLLNMTSIPCVADAPLLERTASSKYPLMIFSHGLGGNFNAYSAICTALASFGIVVVAPEHRDSSAPMSTIRRADGHKVTTIPYQKHPHAPTAKVLNARNAQLRIRLWELEQLFSVLTGLNEGKSFSNYAVAGTKVKSGPSLKNVLDLRPGCVTWAGHSFGACTMVQFVKSIYYHQLLPSWKDTEFENDLDWRPVFKAVANSDLVRQVTPESPMILLDLWTMPLRAGLTRWLWEKPLPCYDRKLREEEPAPSTNVIAIVSSEFYKWPELLNRMKAALSASPAEAMYTLEKRTSTNSTNYKPLARSRSQLVATPGGKLPPDTEKPEDLVSRQGFEENRDEDQELEAGDELFLTPFATPGDEFPFDKIMMNRRSGFEEWRDWAATASSRNTSADFQRELETSSMREAVDQIKQMQIGLVPEQQQKEEADEDYLGEAIEPALPGSEDEEDEFQDPPILVEMIAEHAEKDCSPAPTLRSSTSSNLTNSTTDSSSSLSTPDSSIHLSRTPSFSSRKASTSTLEPIIKTTSLPTEATSEESLFTPTFRTFSLPPLDLPKLLISPTANTPSPLDPHLYHIPQTAHLSQSDFGVLFPKLIKYLMSAENPVEIIRLNVRAMLAMMRGAGLDVEGYTDEKQGRRREKNDELEVEDEDDEDDILTDRCKEERWVRVELYD